MTNLRSSNELLLTALQHDGFAVLPGFLSRSIVAAVLEELNQILQDDENKVCQPTFRALGDVTAMRDLRDSAFVVYKFGPSRGMVDTVGHGFHHLDPATSPTAAVALGTAVGNIALQAGLHDPRVVQTKFVMKPAKNGAKVPVHSDQQYIFTSPSSGLAIWIALDDSNASNGRLEVVPGSHLDTCSGPRFQFDPTSQCAVWVESPPPQTHKPAQPFPSNQHEQDQLNWIGIDAKPGDAILFHFGILHRSASNKSAHPRRALTLHLIDGNTHFPHTNWIPQHDFKSVCCTEE